MNDILKEALKDIPTIKSDLPISAYGSIDLDELNKTVERLNKIPNYDDLMKENNKLQSNWNSLREFINDWIEDLENQRESVEGTDLFENHTLVILDDIKTRINELEGKDKNE